MSENKVIDFSSKDFEKTQEALKSTAKINTLLKDEERLVQQKNEIMNAAVAGGEERDIIQEHLDAFESYDALEEHLKGSLDDPNVVERIEAFFTNEETGEVLELIDNENVKSEKDELDFKRGMLLYFKRTDYYTKKIDEEIENINRVTAELTAEISDALDPLKDNILAYAEYLEQESQIVEGDSDAVIVTKRTKAKKAKAIKSGYTLENMIELIEKHPSIVENAVKDFRNEDRVKAIGKRYSAKLHSANVDFSLFGLISDDIHDSLEYRCLPKEYYPEGFENFTVFFIVRAMSMGMKTKEDIVFHASVQVAFNRLMEGSLDEDVANRIKNSIRKFLQLFV